MDKFFEILESIVPLKSNIKKHIESVAESIFVDENYGLVSAGARQHAVHFVVRGIVRASFTHKGKDKTRWFFSKGDLALSLEGFLTDMPSSETLKTATKAELIAIRREDYYVLMDCYPEFREINKTLFDVYFRRKSLYETQMMLSPGNQRYEWFQLNYPHISSHVQIQHVASFLRLTPQSLSRTRGEFKKIQS